LLSALLVAYMVAMTLIAGLANRQLVEHLTLRFENVDLVEQLRLQKAEAEQANQAKSNFLAAASHDLRQPVHALSLFIGALRGHDLDDEAKRLVEHIDGSVGAMDDLFASLLDISKLDAGVVKARFEPVDIADMLKRLCRDHAKEADDKGVRVRFVTPSPWVLSDPILLERAIRNLLSNALRYTDRGSVLIGCRRRGQNLSVEIWDSGCGIATADQALIFQEFYQVANPERDRTKGLGLGLAIVKRLSGLLDAPLIIESRLGHGSVFKLMLPVSQRNTAPANHDLIAQNPLDKPLFIVVIDDETAIQYAMQALRTRWGHRVLVAGSASEMIALLGHDTLNAPPDLIISDYRLRDHETGIAAIEKIFNHVGKVFPAMLITGDSAPERIAEAQMSGFLLLHKPLSNAKLRAAIGNIIR
jgi:signal transduction histidine kinase/CheY-like chemotaxis protein